jgi:hypothetical protein
LFEVGTDHRPADPEPLEAMLEAFESVVTYLLMLLIYRTPNGGG